MEVSREHAIRSGEGERVDIFGLGVRFLLDGRMTKERFSIVEHPLAARALNAPVHTHRNEDEYTYVIEGRIGIQLGDEVLEAGAGDLVLKPRGIPHAFWNAGDEPARVLEVISPAGFENYFREMAPLVAAGPPDEAAVAAVVARYGLEMDRSSIPVLVRRYGLRLG